MNDFVDLEELKDDEIAALLARARELETRPALDALRGRVLALLFLNPSLRTLASTQAAMARLGGSSFVIQPQRGSWNLELEPGVVMDGDRPEHIREAIPVLERYCDALGLRAFSRGLSLDDDLREPVLGAVRELTRKPLVNLESALDHPCQALSDWKTLDDLKIPDRGGRLVLSWAWHPKPLPLAVPSAVLAMACRRGMSVTVLRPEGFELPRPVMDRAARAAEKSGGSLRETADRENALEDAHVLYAKSWRGGHEVETGERSGPDRAPLRHWCVEESWFAPAAPEAVFMHCLPVRRNVVVKDEVLDGPRSRVVSQAGNRLPVTQAVLLELMKEKG